MTGIRYRPEIDGLRAIAVLGVVLYHAGIGPGAGLVGVDVFFVISGYLITALLFREWTATGRIDLLAFYARRVRRIFPALIVVVLGAVAASVLLLSPIGEQLKLAQSAAASLLFAGNFYFRANSGGYFDPSSDRLPLLHLWSLGVEEQFYLLWPLVLTLLWRLRPKSLVPAIALLGGASLLLAEILVSRDPSAAFYQMPARFWELAAGGLIALSPADQLPDGRAPACVGIVVVLASMAIPIAHFPALGVLPAVAGAAMLILAVHGSNRLGLVGAWLTSRPMVLIGVISYSLYLWHWPLLAFYRATHIGPAPISMRAALVVCAIVLAWLSYRSVERPLRRPDPGTSNPRIVVAGLVASGSLAFLVLTLAGFLRQEPMPNDLASRTSRDMPANRPMCNYRGDEALAVFPKPNCNSVPDKPVRVAIWGDSHALAWQPLAWEIARRNGVAATSYTRDACAPVLDYDNGKRSLEQKRCREFNDLAFRNIDGLDTLVMTARWPTDPAERNFKDRFQATIRQVSSRVRRIILLGPTPELLDDAPRCIESSRLPACAVSRVEFDSRSGAARKLLLGIASEFANVEYVEPANFFCTAVACPVLKDGYSLYWDSNHISSTAARKFSAQYLGSKAAADPP